METNASSKVGKDFDFFGQTAKVSNAINEEQLRFSRQPAPSKPADPPKQTTKGPYKTGYESYRNPSYIPDLEVNASLWATAPKDGNNAHKDRSKTDELGTNSAYQQDSIASSSKKMMSLEEVEAAMRVQAKKPSASSVLQEQGHMQPPLQGQRHVAPQLSQSASALTDSQRQQAHQLSQGQQKASQPSQPSQHEFPAGVSASDQPINASHSAQRIHRQSENRDPPQPRQILQNPKRQPAQLAPRQPEPLLHLRPQPSGPVAAQSGQPYPFPIITHPQQLMQLSEEDRKAFLIEDAKRAKRNHKIYLLSKDNGLMTPQDKNFITRIQLQQLMTATGNTNDHDPDASLSEDFYYQVHNQIRGSLRQNPQQPLSNFAQTYLFQTGSRQGVVGRRSNRSGDNHMQRMEQQVHRAVEAAKLKPKNKQLIIEGSLGKISFSNAKTPKPLLNIKKQENNDGAKRPSSAGRQGSAKKPVQSSLGISDRKSVLRNIEEAYSVLMQMEDFERRLPQILDEVNSDSTQQQEQWRLTVQELNQKLWDSLKVLEPIVPDSHVLHPFIAFLSHPKGKKAIPRIFRHIDQEQRLTILTMILVHLNVLDVVRLVQPQPKGLQPSANTREEVELFCQAVMPSLFACINEAPLNIITGLLGIVLDRGNMQIIARSKVGLDVLTTLISRAEILKQAEESDDQEWFHWLSFYNRLFDTIEPFLGDVFPGNVNVGQDVYVWQFLAAVGIGASPDQQQRLVLAVK